MLDQDASGLDIFGAINFSDNLSAMKRLEKKIRELQRANDTSGTVGIVDTSVGQLSQHDALARDVEFYWTMAFPKLFPFGMGDRSSPSFGQVVPMSLTQWADFLWHHGSGRFAAHPVFRFVLITAIQKEQVFSSSSYYLRRNPNVGARTVSDSLRNLREGDAAAPIAFMLFVGNNVADTDGYWSRQTSEVSAWLRYKQAYKNQIPLFFLSGSYAEHHDPGLRRLLRRVEKQMRVAAGDTEEAAKEYACKRVQDKYSEVLRDRSTYVLSYFSKKTDAFFKHVCRAVLRSTDYYVRFEFAKSRGAIHLHAILFSEQDVDVNNADEVCRIARDEFGLTAHIDSLHENMTTKEALASAKVPYGADPDVRTDLAALAKTCMMHKCSAYCISRSRECRMGFGKVGPSNIAQGKPLIDEDRVNDEGKVRRVEMKRNHKYLVQHSVPLLLAWRANIDLQMILDSRLAGILRYVTGYVCKAGASTKEYMSIYRALLKSDLRREGDDQSISRSLRRLGYSMLRTREQSSQNVDFLLLSNAKLFKATFVAKIFSCHMGEGGMITGINNDDTLVESRNDIHDYIDDMKRRRENGEPLIPLFTFAVEHVQQRGERDGFGRERIPRIIGVRLTVGYPISEESARGLMIVHYSPGWTDLSELKLESPTWADAFNRWSNEAEFPEFLRVEFNAAREQAREQEDEDDDDNDNAQDTEEDLGYVPPNLPDIEYDEAEDEPLGDDNPPPRGEFAVLDYAGVDVEAMKKALADLVAESSSTVVSRDIPDVEDVRQRLALCGEDQRLLVSGVLQYLARIKERLGDTPFTVENVLLLNEDPFRIIVSGSAGTGKSYVLKIIDDCICLAAGGVRLVEVVAPTGAAASNVGGRTLHSALGFGTSFKDPTANQRLQLEALGARTLLLAIDERSMVSSNLLGRVCSRLKVAFNSDDDGDDFGRLPMLILFGDDAQLAPVHGRPLWQPAQDTDEHSLVGVRAYRSIRFAVELRQQMRQREAAEQELREFFSRFRDGNLDFSDVQYLNARRLTLGFNGTFHIRADPAFRYGLNTLSLFSTNEERNVHNVKMLHLLGEPCKTVSSERLCLCRTNTTSTPSRCHVAQASRVKLTTNILPLYGLANGSIGFVVDFSIERLVFVYFPLYSGRPLLENLPEVWDPVFDKLRRVYGLEEDNVYMRRRTIPIEVGEIFCSKCKRPGRRGLPLTEAFGLTGHSSQGMTVPDAKLGLRNVVVTPASQSQEAKFNHAHLFVMLTRVRGLANLGISPSINWRFLEAINASEFQIQRRAEEERLRAMATTFRNELEHDNLDNLFHTVCM